MKFTVIFPSYESYDLSIGIVYTPCLVWVQGQRKLLIPHRDKPNYLRGDLQKLFSNTNIRERIYNYSEKVVIVVHPIGHGTSECLRLLVEDLEFEGFDVTIVNQ